LWQEVQNIHFTWRLHRQLFGTSPDRIQLLNRFGGIVFGCLQRLLQHHVPLSIFRLLDPATQRGGRDENLCLERLATVVMGNCPSLGAQLNDRLTRIRGYMEPFGDLRNKVIAHNDLRTTPARYDGTSNVSGPSREITESVLGEVREFMNGVQRHYGEGESYYYDATIHDPGDGETLIRHLTDLATRIDSRQQRPGGRG
jgi:hypothetical protein